MLADRAGLSSMGYLFCCSTVDPSLSRRLQRAPLKLEAWRPSRTVDFDSGTSERTVGMPLPLVALVLYLPCPGFARGHPCGVPCSDYTLTCSAGFCLELFLSQKLTTVTFTRSYRCVAFAEQWARHERAVFSKCTLHSASAALL